MRDPLPPRHCNQCGTALEQRTQRTWRVDVYDIRRRCPTCQPTPEAH